MTPNEAARVYVDLVQLEESLAPDQHQARQEVSALRSKYHDVLADVLRSAGVSCPDRFEVNRYAFELIRAE